MLDVEAKGLAAVAETTHTGTGVPTAREHPSPEARTEEAAGPWHRVAPWVLTVSSILVLIALAVFLAENVLWFRDAALNESAASNGKYRIYIFHLHLSMVKRSVGLFAGFALIFVGAAVAFYTIREHTHFEGKFAETATTKLSTASPGIVAMILGALLITFAIHSKDEYESLSTLDDSRGAVITVPPRE